MADDDLETLMSARAALAKRRLSWAQTIATAGDIPEGAIKAIIDVQQAIEVIDLAIEELEEANLEKELEEAEERTTNSKNPPAPHRLSELRHLDGGTNHSLRGQARHSRSPKVHSPKPGDSLCQGGRAAPTQVPHRCSGPFCVTKGNELLHTLR